MNKVGKTFNILKYLPLVALLFLAQELKGQNWDIQHMPTEKINMFISPDDTPQALEYNAFNALDNTVNTRAEMDAMIQSRINPDWISTMAKWINETYPNGPPLEYEPWDCGNSSNGLMINSIKLVEGIYGGGGFQDDKLLFDKYKGFDLDSILKNEGTLIDNGKLGLPLYTVTITTLTGGHGMNVVVTGKSLTDWFSYCFIEPQFDQINVQPGQAYMSNNLNNVIIDYWFTYNNPNGRKELATVPVAFFTVTNGVPKFEGLNPYLKDLLITERENDRPIINVKSTSDQDSLLVEIIEKNLKKAEVIIDGGTPISISQNEKKKLGLSVGAHNIQIIALDYFRLSSDTTINRIIPEPTLETKLYPNPAEDILHVKYKTGMSGNAFMSIYTLDGKPVMRKKINGATEEDLDMTEFSQGLYLMNIIDGSGVQRIKFINK